MQYKSSGRPLHPRLIAAGAILLIAAFISDYLYWRTLLFMWNNFSAWLLAFGMIMAVVAAIALLVDYLQKRISGIAWPWFAAVVVAALLSLLNAFVHSRDAYTAVVPDGIRLSAIVTVILLVLGWRGFSVAIVTHTEQTEAGETR